MNNAKPKILIGIAAYNSAGNILNMVNSLLNQKAEDFDFDIFVHSDNSLDNTVQLLSQLQNTNLQVEDNKLRRGFAGTVKHILNIGKYYRAVVVLNDDIVIKDNEFICKLVTPVLRSNRKIGLVTGNPLPIEASNFIQKAGNTSFSIYRRIAYSINHAKRVF